MVDNPVAAVVQRRMASMVGSISYSFMVAMSTGESINGTGSMRFSGCMRANVGSHYYITR